MVDVFTYLDYRKYLKDRYADEKATNKKFSYRYFARIAGLSSPGFLKMVMDGQRNLTPSSINQFAKAFKFSKKEEAYFEALVLYNQAKTDKEKDLYFERLGNLKPRTQLTGLQKDQYEYFTQKHLVVLREMTALKNFKEDPAWIARHIRENITPKEVKEALKVLLRLGLLERDENGKLSHASGTVTTPPEVKSIDIFKFHREMLNEAKEAMTQTRSELRDVTALTIPVSIKTMPAIKKKIQALRQDIIDLINQAEEDFDDVYQINVQAFPVTLARLDEKK